MRLLNGILAYGASLIMTVILVLLYIPTVMIMLVPATISLTKTYLRNSKELIISILEV